MDDVRQSGWKNSRQADRPAGRQEQTMSGRQADGIKQSGKQANDVRQAGKQIKQISRQPGMQAGRHAGRQISRQADRRC
jgi:hypothetical protein